MPLRLRELEGRYRRFGGPATADPVWSREFVATIDLDRFRADGPFVWQKDLPNLDDAAMRASFDFLRGSQASSLLDALDEDGAFGARTLAFGGKTVSRDLLDSVSELFFLDRHVGLAGREALSAIDIGAGYGRLAHRAATLFPRVRWLSTDAVATSTFLAERYLAFRGLAGRAPVVPLDELEAALARERVALAVNVHSFSECTPAAVEWWLGRLAGAGVGRLFLVPNAVSADGREPLANSGESMAPLLAAAGYRPAVVEPKYADPETQRRGLSPTAYFLYRLRPAQPRAQEVSS
jgi:hypothetical protein